MWWAIAWVVRIMTPTDMSMTLTWYDTDIALIRHWHTFDNLTWHTVDIALTIWHVTLTAMTWHATDTALTSSSSDYLMTCHWHRTDRGPTQHWHDSDDMPLTQDWQRTDTTLAWHRQSDTSHHWHTGIHMTHCDGSDTALIIWHVKFLTCQAADFTATAGFFVIVENNHATYFDLLWSRALQRDISIQ